MSRDVRPGIERRGIGDERLAQVPGRLCSAPPGPYGAHRATVAGQGPLPSPQHRTESASTLRSLACQGANDADEVAFRVHEPRPFASIRRPSNAALCPRSGVPYSSNSTPATPHLFDCSAYVGDLNDGLRESSGRPRLGGIDEELVDAISNRQAQLPIACLERAGLDCLEPHFLNVERFGSARVLCRKRRRNPKRLHRYLLCGSPLKSRLHSTMMPRRNRQRLPETARVEYPQIAGMSHGCAAIF